MKHDLILTNEEHTKLDWAWTIIINIMAKYGLDEIRSSDSEKKFDLKVTLLEHPINDF